MAKCMMCGDDAEVGNLCGACANGFNSSSNVRKAEAMSSETKYTYTACEKVVSGTGPICNNCLVTYAPAIKDYINKHPGCTYGDLVWSKEPSAPRKVLYAFHKAGILKIK